MEDSFIAKHFNLAVKHLETKHIKYHYKSCLLSDISNYNSKPLAKLYDCLSIHKLKIKTCLYKFVKIGCNAISLRTFKELATS